MAIWNQNYDANSYVTKGYDLPDQQIMGAINARTQYFISSAEKLKNEYDSTFDFNLSNNILKNSLRGAQQEIDEKMKGLLKKDLTISDNSSAIRNLYKPVMQNQNFIADEQLTNKIQSGFQQAQGDLKKNGADHYNMKSIQVMNNTLEDWKNDDPSNIDRYNSDALGTTYQPYDPKIDKEFNKQIQDRVKNGKIKIDIPDGQGRITTQEEVDLNSIQAQEYIRSIRPQQHQIQDALDSKLYAHSLRNSSPEERQQYITQIEGLKKYNIDKQVSFIQAERHKTEASFALLPSEDQEKEKDKYKKVLSIYDDDLKNAQSIYSDFDPNAYFDVNKKNIAENQLQTILSQRNINGIVDGMGLDNVSRTTKSDTAYWNRQTQDYNERKLEAEQEWRKAQLIAKANSTKKTGANGLPEGENPNIQPASDISSVGTAGLVGEDREEAVGKEIQTTLKGEIEAKKSDIQSGIFKQLNIMVNNHDGMGSIDAFSALDQYPSSSKFGDILDNVTGMNENNKTFLRALVNEGSYKLSNGKFYKEGTLPQISLREAKLDIKAALEDPDIINRVIKKARIESGDFNAADYLGYQAGQIKYDEATQKQRYSSSYVNAAKAAGIKGKDFDQLKYYDEDSFVKDITPELLSKGFNASDIQDFTKALKEKKDLKMTLAYDHGIPHLVNNSLNPHLSNLINYQDKWNVYQKNLNKNLTNVSTGASNYNTATFKIDTKNTLTDKTFDRNSDFTINGFRQLINNNSVSANITGSSPDGELITKVKRLANEYSNVINGFAVYDDGKSSFIVPTLDRSTDNDAAIKEVGLDPQKLANTRIQISRSAVEGIGFKPQSEATSQLQHGKIFGSDLPSGKSFTFYNSGSPSSPKIEFTGSLMVPTIDMNTGMFALKQFTTANFVRAKGIEQSIAGGNADGVASKLYQTDADAKSILDILSKYNIDYSGEKVLTFAQLPKEVRDELRQKSISFKNIKE